MSVDGGSPVPVTGDSGYIGGRLLKRSRRPVGPFAASLVAPIFLDQESLHSRTGVFLSRIRPHRRHSSEPLRRLSLRRLLQGGPQLRP